MYSADMGRPNRAVQTVLGVLVLKEMFDIEALEALEFNLLWHHALGLELEEAHLAQKTQRPRSGVLRDDGPDDRGSVYSKQRVDSTHIMSEHRGVDGAVLRDGPGVSGR